MKLLANKLIQKSQWGKPNGEEGPPDIEQLFKKLFGKSGSKSSGGKPAEPGKMFGFAFWMILIVLAVIWALSGIFIVQPAERAAILRFGKYIGTVQPGPHWIPRFIDQRYVINVDQIMTMNLKDTMLTSQENIVDVDFAVQYRIGNLEEYLFNVVNPQNSLRQIVDSAIRQVIGTSRLDNILTIGRAKIAEEVRQQITFLVNRYKLGLVITDVAMQPAKAPDPVKDAFDDVIKAREDNQRIQNEAEAYANKIVPVAEGRASRIMQAATAYRQQVVLKAKGDVAQFDALLPIYDQAPGVTSDRMYLNTMQEVLRNSHVTLIDSSKGNNVFYIPLDKNAVQPVLPAEKTNSQSSRSNTAEASADAQKAAAAATMRHYLRWREAQSNG